MTEPDSQFDDLPRASTPTDDNRSSFYARLLDSVFDGVYFVDAERKITYWNRGAESLNGVFGRRSRGKALF